MLVNPKLNTCSADSILHIAKYKLIQLCQRVLFFKKIFSDNLFTKTLFLYEKYTLYLQKDIILIHIFKYEIPMR